MRQPLRVDRASACLGEGGSYEIWSHGVPEDPEDPENPKPLQDRLGALGLYVVSLAVKPEAVVEDLGLAGVPRPNRILGWVKKYGQTQQGEEFVKVPFGHDFIPADACVVRLCTLHGGVVREAAYRAVWALGPVAVPICTTSIAWGEENKDGLGLVTVVGREQSLNAASLPTTNREWLESVRYDQVLSVPTRIPGVNEVLHSREKPELRPDGWSNSIERLEFTSTSPDEFSVPEVDQG